MGILWKGRGGLSGTVHLLRPAGLRVYGSTLVGSFRLTNRSHRLTAPFVKMKNKNTKS
jgi:hypothetical protein